MTDDLYRRKWPEADNRVSRQYVKVEPLRESNLKTFIRQAWNPAKKEVFGRNAASWGEYLFKFFIIASGQCWGIHTKDGFWDQKVDNIIKVGE